uniref:Peptidase S1 domain-containing protein n=1 Tax=Sus scrofa TaxID=9823 RepID=A0A8D0PLN6_PIG
MCRLPLPLLLFLLCSRAKAGEGIIGGPKSKPHSRPCMAHLETVTPQDKLPARGGFLIRRGFVRTAAHCAGRSVTVTLGAHTIKKKEDTWPKLEVIKQFPHPKHDYFQLPQSPLVALTALVSFPVERESHPDPGHGDAPPSTPIQHRPTWETVPGAGWRRTTGEESASRTLQEGKLRLVEPQACRHFTAFDYSLQLCVGNPQKAKPALTGDSGASSVLWGVSYGPSDAKPPAVFTRISHDGPWTKIMKSL